MNTQQQAASAQHKYHHTVPESIHRFITNAGNEHAMHVIDPIQNVLGPLHDHFPTSENVNSSKMVMKQRFVVLGAGPIGLIYLLKLIEDLHKKQTTHRLDCKILLVEKRENFRYPHDRVVSTVVSGLGPLRKDVWPYADQNLWPACLSLPRFRNVKGEWQTFEKALQSDVDYTTLRHDLMLMLGQMCHQVFGSHDILHFIPNLSIDQSTLPALEASLKACIASRKIPDFCLDTNTLITLTWGWRNRGAGHLIPNNTWRVLGDRGMRISFSLKVTPARSVDALHLWLAHVATHTGLMHAFGERTGNIFLNTRADTMQVSLNIDAGALPGHLIHTIESGQPVRIRQLPNGVTTPLLQRLALEFFNNKNGLADGQQNIAETEPKFQTDSGTGFWNQAISHSPSGCRIVLLGSARISVGASLPSHVTSASLLGSIAGHWQAERLAVLDGALNEFAQHAFLQIKHNMQRLDRKVPSREAFLLANFFPRFEAAVGNKVESLLGQLEATGRDGSFVMKVPVVGDWMKTLDDAAHESMRDILADATIKKDAWSAANDGNIVALMRHFHVPENQLEEWQARARTVAKEEGIQSWAEQTAVKEKSAAEARQLSAAIQHQLSLLS